MTRRTSALETEIVRMLAMLYRHRLMQNDDEGRPTEAAIVIRIAARTVSLLGRTKNNGNLTNFAPCWC
jgi:hypothetical protein